MLSNNGKGSNPRASGMVLRSRISILLVSMFAALASIYVAGRLWQDAQDRVLLVKELDRVNKQGQSAISVDETLKIIACREQHKKLSALETELSRARREGFVSKRSRESNGTYSKTRPLVVLGIFTTFGRKNNREAIRKAWMGNEEKGIVTRFVIGRSANRGDNFDEDIDNENTQRNDFIILDNHVEAPEQLANKTKLFFAFSADKWDAEFYAKVSDDVYVHIGALGNILVTYLDKPRVYIGCMKSGEVYSEPSHKWYEPEWWKFGDKKSYFRHASGGMFVISQALAKFVSINRSILRAYAHDDVSVGSWFIGLDVKHVNEKKFCCSSWSSGLSLTALIYITTIFGLIWLAREMNDSGILCCRSDLRRCLSLHQFRYASFYYGMRGQCKCRLRFVIHDELFRK